MLEQAMETLLAERAFEQISVADIAEAALLNRATFYVHFTDKFDLLESLLASLFRALIRQRGVAFDGTCPSAVYGIALAVCDFLTSMPGCPGQRQVEQHLESAMVVIVRAMLREGMQRHAPGNGRSPEMLSAATAGAIYGAAKDWAGQPGRPKAEEAAATIMELIRPLIARG